MSSPTDGLAQDVEALKARADAADKRIADLEATLDKTLDAFEGLLDGLGVPRAPKS